MLHNILPASFTISFAPLSLTLSKVSTSSLTAASTSVPIKLPPTPFKLVPPIFTRALPFARGVTLVSKAICR